VRVPEDMMGWLRKNRVYLNEVKTKSGVVDLFLGSKAKSTEVVGDNIITVVGNRESIDFAY